jgi:hypothetical protein
MLLWEQSQTPNHHSPALRRLYTREKMAKPVTRTVMYANGTAREVAMVCFDLLIL